MKIIASKNFTTKDKNYIKGDELTGLSLKEIVSLNEKGFIEPLTYEDLVLIQRELENKKNKKEDK